MIRRKRAAPDGIEIPDKLHRTTRGEDFLAHYDEEHDIMIFVTEANIGLQETQRHWFADGAHDSAPHTYLLYTIHVIADQTKTNPVVYCIARNKSEATYNSICGPLYNCRF